MHKLIVVVGCLAACGPTFIVRDGHLTVVSSSVSDVPGARTYSDLGEAVADNPTAAQLAHSSRVASHVGLAIALVGVACIALDGLDYVNQPPGAMPNVDAYRGVFAGCMLGGAIAAAYAYLLAASYASDAIRLYNAVPAPSPSVDDRGLTLAPRHAHATLSMRDVP